MIQLKWMLHICKKKSQSIKLIFNVLPCLGLLNYRNITKQQRTKSLRTGNLWKFKENIQTRKYWSITIIFQVVESE